MSGSGIHLQRMAASFGSRQTDSLKTSFLLRLPPHLTTVCDPEKEVLIGAKQSELKNLAASAPFRSHCSRLFQSMACK